MVGCRPGSSCLLMLCLLTSHRSFVVAIPERRDELLRREYPLEEFLWTGSGEGPDRDEGQISWVTTTVFKTTTRLVATPVSASYSMVTAATCPGETAPCLTPSWQLESSAFLEPSFTESHFETTSVAPSIWATPTISVVATATATLLPTNRPPVWPADFETPDKKFWIVTIVEEGEIETPQKPPFESGLSRLYATAFKRQQEKHLGILNATSAQRLELQRKRRSPEVLVRLLNVTKENPKRIQLIYLVQVKGQPVLARAAVHDMKLVSDAEVVRELGMNVLTKAEPYLKEKEEAIAQDGQVVTASPWVLAAVSISMVSLVGLVAVLLYLAASKRKRTNRLVDGATNMSFEPEVQSCGSGAKMSEDWSVEALEEGQRREENGQSDSSATAAVKRGARKKPPSPTGSYLSMPSVRKFPRGEISPKPMPQLLQQDDHRKDHLSMKNLDVYPDESAFEPPSASTPPPMLIVRHDSLNGDPGVVGPCVYQMARGAASSRRRFQELVDDTFSLFGEQRIHPGDDRSRSPTPPPRPPSPKVDSRVHSAAYLRVSTPAGSPPAPRPRTTEPRRPSLMQQPRRRPLLPASRASSAGPRGAWETPTEPVSGGMRPLSAGPFHRPMKEAGRPPPHPPRVCADYILADSQLGQNDPAVPLISAIKTELKKFHSCSSCSIPGSISPAPQNNLDEDVRPSTEPNLGSLEVDAKEEKGNL